MKYIKYFLLTVILSSGSLAMAGSWSVPSVPPPSGNLEIPFNISGFEQYKRGTLGAFEFCLYDLTGKKITPCIGTVDPKSPTTNFPWVSSGTNDFMNTNTDKPGDIASINIGNGGNIVDFLKKYGPAKRLNVDGGILTDEICLGKVCIKVDPNDPNKVEDFLWNAGKTDGGNNNAVYTKPTQATTPVSRIIDARYGLKLQKTSNPAPLENGMFWYEQ